MLVIYVEKVTQSNCKKGYKKVVFVLCTVPLNMWSMYMALEGMGLVPNL